VNYEQLVGDLNGDLDVVCFHVLVGFQQHVVGRLVVARLLLLIGDGERDFGGLFEEIEDSVDLIKRAYFVGVDGVFGLAELVLAHEIVEQTVGEGVLLGSADHFDHGVDVLISRLLVELQRPAQIAALLVVLGGLRPHVLALVVLGDLQTLFGSLVF